jgi:hypothetical protein
MNQQKIKLADEGLLALRQDFEALVEKYNQLGIGFFAVLELDEVNVGAADQRFAVSYVFDEEKHVLIKRVADFLEVKTESGE